MQEHTSYDIGIVGGGFTGLYLAFRLGKLYPDKNILLLEKADSVGGRILTDVKYGHVLEYGPMRFEPELQPYFAHLLKELKIPTKQFPPYTTPFTYPSYNDLTFSEIQAIESDRLFPPAFALLKHGLKQVLHEQWDVENDNIKNPNRDKQKAWLKEHGRFQGYYLHDIGLWDALAHVLSKTAIDYIMHHGTFYHMIAVNPNAADIITFILDILATCKYHLITVEGGSYELISKLKTELSTSQNVQVCTGVSLQYFKEYSDKVILETTSTSFSCDRVIFTCQKSSMKTIKGFQNNILTLFDSVFVIKLYKIFVILEHPPWDEHTIPQPNFNADKIPCREVHYSYNSANKTGMVMIYGDVPSLHYWRTFLNANQKDRLKDHIHHYLRVMFPHHRYFNILECSLKDWSSPPNVTGVHMWKPGYKSASIANQLACFGENKNLHICGETFSCYQGFIEGCLRSANNVIKIIEGNNAVCEQHNQSLS